MSKPKEIEPLSVWTLKAKDWRVKNGFTTPEWEQHIKWYQARLMATFAFGYIIGAAVGILMGVL